MIGSPQSDKATSKMRKGGLRIENIRVKDLYGFACDYLGAVEK